jgi:hypothetical protein
MSDERMPNRDVSADTVYTQTFAELRGCREHELSVATWVTSVLLVVLGAVIAGKYASPGYPLGVALERCPSLKACLALVPIVLGLFGAWSIGASMNRHARLVRWLTDHFGAAVGPVTRRQSCCRWLSLGTLMCAILVFLGVFTAVLVLHRPSALGRG